MRNFALMFNMLRRRKDKSEVNNFTLSVLLTGLFIGLGGIFYFGALTFIRIDTIFNCTIIAGAVVFLIHLPFYKKLNRFLAELIAYSLVGWGCIIIAVLLIINYSFHKNSETDYYKVHVSANNRRSYDFIWMTIDPAENNMASHIVSIENYIEYPYLLKFDKAREVKCKGVPQTAIITTAEGFFGYRVLLNKELR